MNKARECLISDYFKKDSCVNNETNATLNGTLPAKLDGTEAFSVKSVLSDKDILLPINSSTPISKLPHTEASKELNAMNVKLTAMKVVADKEEDAKDAAVLLAKVKEQKYERDQLTAQMKQDANSFER